MDMNTDGTGHVFGCMAVEAGVKINDNGTFGIFFDNLEPMAIMAMFHPSLVDVVMPQVWAAAEERGIELK